MSTNYCKVMIVEDEFIMRQGMKYMIDWQKEGFELIGEATNGQEALELIEELKPNIIISDIVMPVLNGVEFSKIVQNKYPNIQIIILSSYDNFDYVKSTLLSGAVDYILKPTLSPAQLLSTLKKAVERIPDFELISEDTVYNNTTIEQYICGTVEKIDEKRFLDILPNTIFRIVGVNLRYACGKNKSRYKKLTTQIENFFHNKYKYIKLLINEEELSFLINYKVSEDKTIIEDLEKYIGRYLISNDNVFIVITEKFNNISNVKEIYNKKFAPYLLDKFYYKNKNILNTEQLQKDSKVEKFNFVKYLGYINEKDFDLAVSMVESYITHAISCKYDEYKLKNLIKSLLYNFIVALEGDNVAIDDIRQEAFRQIDDVLYADEFVEIIKKISMRLKSVYVGSNSEEYRIKEILDYINNHYNEALELSDISKVFNFNYYYISSYFNNHCKEGFSEYLNRVRVKKACELLKENQLNISEISSAVGYSDHSYFCRVFKKLKGYTPSSYRRVSKIKEKV